uniref:Major sperm protein n=1 Tax=Wuchereria bancrofti TaxID=6293 RepID=A0AAF5RVB6_WUCBA
MAESSTFSATSSMLPGGIPRPIDHTPDENEFQMTLIPMTRIIFMDEDIGIKPVTACVTIHNNTALVQAFKVKCTSNKMFTIRPAYGIIAPNEKMSIKITFKWKDVPKDDLHFISFYHTRINQNTCNMQPRQIFEKYKPEGVKRIQCQFKNASGQPIHSPDPKPNTEIA